MTELVVLTLTGRVGTKPLKPVRVGIRGCNKV